MGRDETTVTPLAEWIRDELEHRNWGVRTLARKMNPEQPEIARRALNRYLFEGSTPTEANRELIAEALDVDPSEVPGREAAPFQRGGS